MMVVVVRGREGSGRGIDGVMMTDKAKVQVE